jgi:hypothetical protein
MISPDPRGSAPRSPGGQQGKNGGESKAERRVKSINARAGIRVEDRKEMRARVKADEMVLVEVEVGVWARAREKNGRIRRVPKTQPIIINNSSSTTNK